MEVDHDLRKFITETPVALRRGMLSSGREASGVVRSLPATVQRRTVPVAGWTPAGTEEELQIHNVGRLTPGAGIKSSTAMGSDLWAAEALQEAETEVGVGVMIDRGTDTAARVDGGRTDRLTRRPISALRPES
jgi:hypothetical protein